ncbi:MAG: propionate catabolism operon regulatory protein PrpR [Rhodocyclaceae bacterium]|nr:propionate catabolism operon regulatory protein PrpR [Rhodocyclaceae bacterium]
MRHADRQARPSDEHWPQHQDDRRPRIVVLLSHLQRIQSPSRLALEVHDVLPEFGGWADVRVIDRLFDQALEYAMELEQTGACDFLICAGATGAYLRKHLNIPVILMDSSGLGIMHALVRAGSISRQVGVLSYRDVSHEIDSIRAVLSIEVLQASYKDLRSARTQVRNLIRSGCKVVVGSPMVNEIAEEEGITGVLALSAPVCRRAIEDALALWRGSLAEKAKRRRLDSIIHQLRDGVLALDKLGRVESVNVAMARLLDVDVGRALGRDIEELAPGCGLREALDAEREFTNRVLTLRGRSMLANFTSLREGSEAAGAVLTARETAEVQRADGHIRAQTRPGRFAARHVLRDIVAESPVMRAVVALAARYSHADSTVLITGESGTGKELLAQGIHNASHRRDRPFVAINCGALAETLLESELFGYEEGAFTGSRRGGKPGLFEVAHTGTVFLDEIGDMPLPLQTRLLRVLQEREVLRLGGIEPTPIDVRVIAATHRDLKAEVAAGRFRDDLFYRIQVLRVQVPPLRERPGDVGAIASQLADRLVRRLDKLDQPSSAEGMVEALLPHLQAYDWPGNVRELQSVLERALLLGPFQPGDTLDVPTLAAVMPELINRPHPTSASVGLRHLGKATESAHARRVVDECNGDLDAAAKKLGVSRSTVWRRLQSGG